MKTELLSQMKPFTPAANALYIRPLSERELRELHLFQVLLHHTPSGSNECRAKQRTLAREIGLSVRMVQKLLAGLEAKDFIRSVREKYGNRYVITFHLGDKSSTHTVRPDTNCGFATRTDSSHSDTNCGFVSDTNCGFVSRPPYPLNEQITCEQIEGVSHTSSALADAQKLQGRAHQAGVEDIEQYPEHARARPAKLADYVTGGLVCTNKPQPEPNGTVAATALPQAQARQNGQARQPPPVAEAALTQRASAPRDEGFEAWFARFWKFYPRKVARSRAYKMARRKARTADVRDAILAGLFAQLPDFQSREPEYIPHPAHWLEQERWMDAPQPPRKGPLAKWEEQHLVTKAAVAMGIRDAMLKGTYKP